MRIALPLNIAAWGLAFQLSAQIKPAAAPRIEPGLETAVRWKWWVLPSDEKDWGLPMSAPEPAARTPDLDSANPSSASSAPQPNTYEVQKGDALILIGKKFGMTAQQLKAFNGLATDTIRIGQELKIPTPEELSALAPPAKPETETSEQGSTPAATPKPQSFAESRRQDDLLLQVFLDREQFPTGPIDGNPGENFATMSGLYRESREDAQNIDEFKRKARESVGDPITRYALRLDDFRFIAPPATSGTTRKRGSRAASTPSKEPDPLYDDLIAASSLVYRSPWEFVAERFHCDEPFLRSLNPGIKGQPVAGTVFQVPNVIPFEIEKALEEPLQPAVDPQVAVKAAIVNLSRIEITHNDKLVAVMPLALARPDLRGRGAWTILGAIPRPRLATLQELKEGTTKPPAGSSEADDSVPAPSRAALAAEQYLAAGPNNPVGVAWIHLAKAKSTEPLPYGLHGTSIPSRMRSQEGIGGLRLANWDIVRALRLLPNGTPLQWK